MIHPSESDQALLIEMYNAGVRHKVMAQRLGISINMVSYRLKFLQDKGLVELGLRRAPREQDEWNPLPSVGKDKLLSRLRRIHGKGLLMGDGR